MELIFSELDFKKIENTIESKKCFHNFCIKSLTNEVVFLSIENNKAKAIFIERENLYYNNNGSLHISKGEKTHELLNKSNAKTILSKYATTNVNSNKEDKIQMDNIIHKIINKLSF